jgi:hypothetical protein
MSTVNKSEDDRRYKRTQAQIIRNLASELGAKVSHCGSTWWELEHNGKTWKIRGASNVIRSLELMKA